MQQSEPIILDDDKQEWNRNRIWRQLLTLRTNNAISKLYNYKKFNKGYVQENETEKAINISKCPYLADVDIDIDKKLDEQQRKVIHDELLQQLNSNKSLKVGLVQTAHGGIHSYCHMNDNKLRQNSMTAIIKSLESNPLNKRYGVDVFACVTPYNEESKEKTLRQVVLPESIVKDKDSDVELQYTNLNKMWNITKLSNIKKVFQTLKFDMNLILDIDKPKVTQLPALVEQESFQQITNGQEVVDDFAMKYIQRDKSYDISQSDSKIEMTQQTCILLCNVLKGLQIHNEAQELKKEITFLVLFKAVNSLIKIDDIEEEFINDVYQRIRTMNNLTDSAKKHFDTQRERYKNEMTNPFILQGIIRDYNPTYYKDVVLKQLDKTKNDDNISDRTSSVSMKSQSSYRNLDKTQIHISKIDLDDLFTLVDIEMKIYNQEYECDEDIVTDMLKIMRIINQKNDIFVMKRYDSTVKRCIFDILSDDAAQKKLSKAKWD
ncbi:MAG: hypothetical protein EZS28_014144 [Streblomastix strix]|uniref:Uncharacterized protein n=1 Tax=Streblomastix strix TaxID=222440 RepID=A0A5J4W640_9EUKA|nr:MAG: hypothetical protein EZS28_014144 [Streblomastix strix]